MSPRKLIRLRVAALGLGATDRHWQWLALLTSAYAATAVTIYFAAGLGEWSPSFAPISRTLTLCVGFFFVPSLLEELFWRCLLIPPSRLGRFDRRTALFVLGSTAAFTAAHPIAALVFLPHAREVFTGPGFLAIVFLLGLTCGYAYVLSKSIWPPVVIHWVTVLAWKFLLGGPFVLLGR